MRITVKTIILKNSYRLLWLPLVLLIFAHACVEGEADRELKELIEQKKFVKAAEWINTHPEVQIEGQTILPVARAFSEQTKYDKSIPLLKRIVGSDSSIVVAWLLLANNYRDEQNFNEALKIYNDLATIDSVKFLVLPERSRLFTLIGDFERSRQDINAARARQPKYFAIYLADGMLNYAQGDFEKALELFEKTIKLDPGVSAEAALYSGYVLLSSNINLQAMHKFTEAIENGKNINKGYAFINRGVCQFNLADTIFACNDWDSAMSYLPEQAKTYLDNYCQDLPEKRKEKWTKQ